MSKEKELVFCFYCGNLIKEFKEGETKICPYCGVKLSYKENKIKVHH